MQELIIEPNRFDRQYWKDLWRYRELLYFLAWRDILVRYKQTVIGVAWALIRPLITMIVLTVVFSVFAKLPSGGAPYPLLVMCGMLPWQFFANALTESGSSLVANASMISKVYFPRLIVPASSVVTSCVDFGISCILLLGVMGWYQWMPDTRALLVPIFILLAVASAFGAGLWIAAATVRFRDFRFVVPFIVQFGLYVSPVGFSSDVVPERWRLIYSLNPMVGVIDGFRWSILGGTVQLFLPGVALSFLAVALTIWTGLMYFRHTERTFADII